MEYFDHAATTPLRPEVREAMEPYLAGSFGNPSSMHGVGREAARALRDARRRVAEALGAEPGEIYFVRGGTEADNLAVKGRVGLGRDGGPPVVACSAVEHRAVLEAAEALEGHGARLHRIPVDRDGTVALDAVDEALASAPDVVSVMWVNNEVGTVEPVEAVADRCRERGVAFHTDAVQALGKLPVDVREVPMDLASFTGHKIQGPKGTGVLFVRGGTELRPLLHGGGQERGLRPGTQDVAGAVGMAAAVELAVSERDAEARRLGELRRRLEEGLTGAVPGLRVTAAGARRAPHIAHVAVPGVEWDALLVSLDVEGFAVSGGSACSSGAVETSHVLEAMLPPEEAREPAVRFSLGPLTGEDGVRRAVERVPAVIRRLREAEA